MTILEIIKIKELNPVTLTADEIKEKIFFDFGDQEIKAQTGSVTIEVSKLEGELEGLDEIIFLFDSTNRGNITWFKKQESGNYSVNLKLESIYLDGFELSIQHFIVPGKILISITEEEKESLLKFNNQKLFLSTLLKYYLPKRHDSILYLATKAYRCNPNESNDETKSHFLGNPKYNTISLFHISTLFSDQIEEIESIKHLSFYIDINNSNNGWPEKEGDFKVTTKIESSLNRADTYYEAANNFSIQTYLDIPSYNHSSLFQLKLTFEEIDIYSELRSFYFEHIVDKSSIGEEVNKIFGYPDSIQNCVSYEAERIKNKREYSDEIYEDAQHWMLLLQISPYCKKFNFFEKFGDGSIYFMIRKKDFLEENFENCQVIVQNT